MTKLNITFLGTGTSQGVPVIGCDCEVCVSEDSRDKRLRSSVLLSVDGHNLCIDSGPDFRQQMLREKVQNLDAILYTHQHKDHLAGMDDVRAFNFKHKKDMPLYCDIRVEEALRREFYYVFENQNYPGIPKVKIHSIDKNSVLDLVGFPLIKAIEVLHHKLPVLGYRVGKFAYITDCKTILDPEKEKLKDLDVLVLNALRREEHISHLNLEQALTLVKELKPRKCYFTHISHLFDLHENIERELPENVKIAFDGLKIEVELD